MWGLKLRGLGQGLKLGAGAHGLGFEGLGLKVQGFRRQGLGGLNQGFREGVLGRV